MLQILFIFIIQGPYFIW